MLPPIQTELSHRGALLGDNTPLYPPADFFEALGGRNAVGRLIDGLYDRIEADPILRPAFNRDLTVERASQKRFFEAWFGGEHRYFDWQPGLRIRHSTVSISRGMAGRWVGHFLASLGEVTDDSELIFRIRPVVTRFAMALVNQDDEPAQGTRLNLTCPSPSIRQFEASIARDDSIGLSDASLAYPDVLGFHGSSLLLSATIRGKARSVAELLAKSVDPNRPSMPTGVECNTFGLPALYMTPLCAAMLKRRDAVIQVLLDHGAEYDIFTACCVGNLGDVEEALQRKPDLVDAWDPACDVAGVTPLLHAVYAGRLDVARHLLGRGATVGANSGRLLRSAADQGNEALTDLLLAHGADASAVGAGDWGLYPAIAQKLVERGADVNREPGRWIGLCCTGNSGHKERLELARGLLACEADTKAYYRGGTAMHHAARAGFVNILAALVEYGADVNALDVNGLPPLYALENAGRMVDRNAVRRVLLNLGAVESKRGRAN